MPVKKKTATKQKDMTLYITDRGKLFSDKDLKRFEMPQSKQLVEDGKFGNEVIEPPFNLSKLMAWLDVNVVHSSCVRTKTQDSVGIGYHLEEVEDIEVSESQSEKERLRLMTFFNKVNESEDITGVMKKAFLDYEGTGNGYLEIIREVGEDKAIKHIYHVNATNVRWSKTKDKYIQRVGAKKVFFKCFGSDEVMNKNTGDVGKEITDPKDIANELLQIKMYTYRSHWYGLPEWLSAIGQMYGQMKEAEYNLDFFSNYGVPSYAVIIKGMKMNTIVEETIKKYFETEVKADPHKTMVFGLPQGGEITFEKLSVDTKESSFNVYRMSTRDDILTAHRTPPYRAGIVEKGQLGGSIVGDVDRIYLDSVINPRQRDWEWVINQLIIKEGFGIEAWQFKFDDIDIDDKKMQVDIDTKYFQMGVYTPNQLRKKLGLEGYGDDGDTYYVASNLIAVGDIGEVEEKADVRDYFEDDDQIFRDEAVAKYDQASEVDWLTDEEVSVINHPKQKMYSVVRHSLQQAFKGGHFRKVKIGINGATAIVGKLADSGEVELQSFIEERIHEN